VFVFEDLLLVAPVVVAGILAVRFVVASLGCTNFLFVHSVVFALLVQGSLPVLEVIAPA
jgi:hypothetical protein